jgi:hypothetical protein
LKIQKITLCNVFVVFEKFKHMILWRDLRTPAALQNHAIMFLSAINGPTKEIRIISNKKMPASRAEDFAATVCRKTKIYQRRKEQDQNYAQDKNQSRSCQTL